MKQVLTIILFMAPMIAIAQEENPLSKFLGEYGAIVGIAAGAIIAVLDHLIAKSKLKSNSIIDIIKSILLFFVPKKKQD